MKLFKRNKVIPGAVDVQQSSLSPPASPSVSSVSTSLSLGAGNVSFDGNNVNFVPSPRRSKSNPRSLSPTRRMGGSFVNRLKEPLEKILQKPVFKRDDCAFLRVSDLRISESISLSAHSTAVSDTLSNTSSCDEAYPNFHHVSAAPPPGVDEDPSERWIALDDGEGQYAPIAPFAIEALVEFSRLSTLHDEAMWKPDSKTAKCMKSNHWASCTWAVKESATDSGNASTTAIPHAHLIPALGSPEEDQILMWSGNFSHGFYGSDLPAIRSACIMPTSARSLMELFVDSSRVHEYNKLSLGRKDLIVLQSDMSTEGPFGGITKVCRSETSPPLIRKTLQFTSLMHARALPNGGYKLVTRAVEKAEEHHNAAMKSEILLGVNVILPIDETRCLLILVNHIRSPMVPMMVAKRIGLQAAVGFIHDVRACCK